jgi:fructose-1,6-bisphosphatase/inositol monophosphatase family enzyme
VATKAHAADLVTDVDRAVERHVREVLAAEFPAHVVVGEEEGGTARAGVPCWYLDPVDGTTNYAHGLGWSSFSLALALDETPLVGVVADPWRGEVWSARAATLDGVPLRLDDAPPEQGTALAGTLVLTEWAAHVPFPGQPELLADLAAQHVTTRVLGSGTLSTVSVGAGRAAGCVIGDFHPEDHLAATLIAREAGARCLDADGRETAWPRGAFLVAAPAYAEALGDLLTRRCR